MALIVELLSWVCIVGGSFFAVVGGIGIVRLPDFYSRLHGGGVTDTMGAGLIILGLMFQAGLTLITVKLLMIFFFLFITSPTACHALASAALARDVEPLLSGED